MAIHVCEIAVAAGCSDIGERARGVRRAAEQCLAGPLEAAAEEVLIRCQSDLLGEHVNQPVVVAAKRACNGGDVRYGRALGAREAMK